MRESLYYGAVWTALASIAAADAPSAEQWAERSIYQIMTDRFARPKGSSDAACDPFKYCGGSWAGIIEKLDYIQDLGFTAIQISPVVENIPDDTKYGEAYHGYWPRNLYALNDHFGTDGDLRSLASELHKRDMYLMVDVVINDMAQAINGSMDDHPQPKIDYSQLIPFNDEKYYHPYCSITDWNNPAIYQGCWFGSDVVALPDLKTEDKEVETMIQTWVKELVSNYSIDGLRIDATKHMNDEYVIGFSKAAGVFTMGEVYTEDTDLVCKYEDMVTGLLNYPVYQPVVQAFTAGDMLRLAESVRTVEKKCKDFTRLATFVENHDITRFASLVNDTTLAKNAMAFNILADGIPIIYQGQEQHMAGNFSPYNREALWTTEYDTKGPLYGLTATLNKLRNHAISIDNHYVTNHSIELYLDNSTYATRKGPEGVQVVSVFSNQGSKGGKYDLTLKDAFAPNTEVMEVLGCSKLTANDAGNLTVKMDAGEPKVFFPTSHLDGSGLCGYKARETQSNSTSDNSTNSDKDKDDKNLGSVAAIPYPMLLSGAVLAAIISWVF
ncbi:alpha-amylase [Aspergillus clavatus NRRL 1]|uniref:alpha-amylase n=1 Tax=Aspergillus clavatus (strain ATCC 1007 / CBS 513.65 / DSM 816 / NCTC 3887 / NRRL 1 / QM 1276 / 107) TaxID=344612 RepID=A1C723_ASPCL|nr:alpha-amylase, putative [Aspergillus clavatus NRRL 1]EAW14194.1 alpha-amylase, putative [Aspergillus clavatus NRRL 1]